MRDRIRTGAVASLAIASFFLLASCGSESGLLSRADIDGVWLNDGRAGGPPGMMLAVGDSAYGYQVTGGTTRYFKGAAYSSKGQAVDYDNSRYVEAQGGRATASLDGRLSGRLVANGTKRQLLVDYGAAGAASNFSTMVMNPPAAALATVADMRDFAGSFPLPAGTLSVSADSAISASVSGSGVNGCSVNGTLDLPRPDRNVWAVTLTQSGCADSARNGLVTRGLAMLYKSPTKFNIAILGEDGRAWTLLSSSRLQG